MGMSDLTDMHITPEGHTSTYNRVDDQSLP